MVNKEDTEMIIKEKIFEEMLNEDKKKIFEEMLNADIEKVDIHIDFNDPELVKLRDEYFRELKILEEKSDMKCGIDFKLLQFLKQHPYLSQL